MKLPGILVSLIACSLFALASSGHKHAMTFEDVVGLRRASEVQISPDGRRVAFVLTAWDRENDRFNSDIWLAFDSREPAIPLTSNPRRDDQPRWSPDGRRLAFLSERAANDPASPGAQIFLLNLQGGEPVQLTFHKSSIQNFAWSPDGRTIAFIAEEPRLPKKTKPPLVVDEDQRYAQLWLVDVKTQEIRQLSKGKRHVVAFDWSADGSRIVLTARASPQLIDAGSTEVYVIPTDLKDSPYDVAASRRITNNERAESEPHFSPDGRWISYLARDGSGADVGPMRIHLVPAAGGEPRILGGEFAGHISNYSWVFNSQRVIFLAGLGLYSRIYTMSLQDDEPQVITRDEGVTTGFSATSDAMNIAFIHENPRLSSEIAYLSSRIMIPVFLTQLNPQIEEFSLGQVESVRWKSNDGAEIEGLLVYPVGYQTGTRYPLLTYIHGGPEGAYIKGFNAGWSAFPQVYAAHGYAVFLPNFRGSSNYGAKFAEANTGLAGKIDYEDVMSGIDELVRRGIADEDRLALAGWSYGGYLSAWIIGHTDRFKCAAYGAGLSDAVSYWGTADIVAQRERLHGGTPWEARQKFVEQSPLTYLSNVKTPALIFHGEKDERVPLGQSLETYRTLKRLGATVQLVIYPDQGHGLAVPSYQLDKMRREFAWVEQYVKKTP
ncbi:MAG: S9 family peptidase [Blastocatellia bacterium]|nr:S9 family peptidase [Blastocatellia bacterium]